MPARYARKSKRENRVENLVGHARERRNHVASRNSLGMLPLNIRPRFPSKPAHRIEANLARRRMLVSVRLLDKLFERAAHSAPPAASSMGWAAGPGA